MQHRESNKAIRYQTSFQFLRRLKMCTDEFALAKLYNETSKLFSFNKTSESRTPFAMNLVLKVMAKARETYVSRVKMNILFNMRGRVEKKQGIGQIICKGRLLCAHRNKLLGMLYKQKSNLRMSYARGTCWPMLANNKSLIFDLNAIRLLENKNEKNDIVSASQNTLQDNNGIFKPKTYPFVVKIFNIFSSLW